jgi:enoyl-CoA hydratase/carnithine racemase
MNSDGSEMSQRSKTSMRSPDTTEVLIERDGGVCVLTLNRPEQRNAFTIDLYRELTTALASANLDRSVGSVVLTGVGTAFSSGTDLGELAELAAGRTPPGAAEAFPGLLKMLSTIDVPLIAAVNGPGVGLGFTILPYCDLVFLARSARLKAPFAQMGVPPEAGSSYLLVARMGWQRAAASLLTGEWLDAEAAVASGIANEVCADDDLLPHAVAVAQRIAESPPGAARGIKRLMQAAQQDAVAAARSREDAAYAQLFARTQP